MIEDRPAEHPQPGEPPRGKKSPRITGNVKLMHDLRVPMRDGVDLALDLLRPDIPGPLPVVLMRTPYDKVLNRGGSSSPLRRASELPDRLAERGYIVALNDCRGRFNSDGVFRPYFDEANDGYDTVEWIAAQPWCDGNVGMFGGSYVGETAWFAASRKPPHLKAIVPYCSPPASLWRNEPVFGGCFLLIMAEWMVVMGRRAYEQMEPMSMLTTQQDYYEALPLSRLPELAGCTSDWWDDWMDHPVLDSFWRQGFFDNQREMGVAALNITGWWDMALSGAPMNFEAMKASQVASRQKLIIGPWPHWVNLKRKLSGIDFGENALIELDDYVIRFLDHWLKGHPNGIDREKPVYVFLTGANEWWAEDDWPLPGTENVAFYFHSRGKANSLTGDGGLSTEAPSAEPPDTYRYDPAAALRILWNMQEGPVDDRIATIRNDCLCYTTARLREPLDVVGWVTCQLYASSSALDTDWHVRLVDVHLDGTAHFLTKGLLRARFRESFERPQLLTPGKTTLFEFTMDACGVRFLPGHRIRVEIFSSWFTQYDRNLNSGAENFFKDDQIVVADQLVYHEKGLASCIVLPVIRRR